MVRRVHAHLRCHAARVVQCSAVEWSEVEWSEVEWSIVQWSIVEYSGVTWSGVMDYCMMMELSYVTWLADWCE